MLIKHVAVVGSGTMGSGIAQVAATAGCSVWLYDTNAAALTKAEENLKSTLSKLVEKGKLSASDASQIQSRIRYTREMQDLSDAQLVIEAIIENLEIKRSLFKQLEAIVSPTCILASNTSSLSIASIAASVQESGRVVGIHFFNPAPLMQLVEVIPAVQTQSETLAVAIETITAWNKVVVRCKDAPGFIVNRVARPYYLEALRMLESGIADIATIDALMEASGFRMGPFRLMDLIGNDINYAVSCSVYEQMGKPERLKPSAVQENKVREGNLGRKTGKGYYSYE